MLSNYKLFFKEISLSGHNTNEKKGLIEMNEVIMFIIKRLCQYYETFITKLYDTINKINNFKDEKLIFLTDYFEGL